MTRRGSIAAPRPRISKCRCGPVERPVDPTVPMRSPTPMHSPRRTAIVFRWAYHDVTPMVDPKRHSAATLALHHTALRYAHARGLVRSHPNCGHLVRIAEPLFPKAPAIVEADIPY